MIPQIMIYPIMALLAGMAWEGYAMGHLDHGRRGGTAAVVAVLVWFVIGVGL
jgi:hypothetical protein